ncbi:MAG: hypothetical protein LBP34_05490 [Flavobacteriaceae bacterium]|jgi:hypothetical protein|nr:hypothetical protein [Flavobacteriaceae bacterium]
MKKLISLLVLMLGFGLVFTGCSDDDDDNYPVYVDYDTIAEVYELDLSIGNFAPKEAKDTLSYYFRKNFTLDYDSDQLLVYRQRGETDSKKPVWELLPSTYYNTQGVVSYNFDFSKEDFSIYVDADYNIKALTPEYLTDQTFRIVIIPGYFPQSKGVAPPVDYNDYDAVIKYFNINDSKIKTLKL